MSYRKCLRRFLYGSISVLALLYLSCSWYLVQVNSFQEATTSLADVTLSANLLGNWNTDKTRPIYGGPYSLSIGIKSSNKSDITVELAELVIEDCITKETVVNRQEVMKRLIHHNPNRSFSASFIIEDPLIKNYHDYALTMKVRIISALGQQEQIVRLLLKTNYQQFKRNAFLDAMHG